MRSQIEKTLKQASALHRAGDLAKAQPLYEAVLCEQPENTKASFELGVLFQSQKRLAEAVKCYQNVVRINPSDVGSWHNLLAAYVDLSRYQEGLEAGKKALQIDSKNPQIWSNLANAWHGLGNPEKGLECCAQALEIDPACAYALCNQGAILRRQGRLSEAERSFRQGIKIAPQMVEIYSNLGTVLAEQFRLKEASIVFEEGLALNPNHSVMLSNFANVAKDMGDYQKATEIYQRAIALEPEAHQARFNFSTLQLLKGFSLEAWQGYQHRFYAEAAWIERFDCPDIPVWQGEAVNGKNIYVYGEQGLGDEVMFIGHIQTLMAQGANCIVSCDERLIPLFKRSFPGLQVFPREQFDALPPLDYQFPMGNLPAFFNAEMKSLPAYLKAEKSLQATWKKRYEDLAPGLKVGISWRAGASPLTQVKRSLKLDRWLPLLNTPDVQFINLQYGDCQADLATLEKTHGIKLHDWPDADPIKDVDNFAAQVAALDLVISVDNSTVHIASALGVPTWIMLPFSPNWRWLTEREDTVWYQSARLFRQPKLYDWNSVVNRVTNELMELTKTRSLSEPTL